MSDTALADDTAEQTGFESLFVTAQDGLRLHVRRYGTPAARRLPIVCLPGLTRNGSDFHELGLAFGRDASQNAETLVQRLAPELKSYLLAHIRPASGERPWTVEVNEMRVGDAEQTQAGKYQEITVRLDLRPPAGAPRSRCNRFLVAFASGTVANSRPGNRSGAGRISNSSGSSLTTTHPSASRHQWPRPTGSTASMIVCSHSSAMAGAYAPRVQVALVVVRTRSGGTCGDQRCHMNAPCW